MELYFKNNTLDILKWSYRMSSENIFSVFTSFKTEEKPFMAFEDIRFENGYIFNESIQEFKILQTWNPFFIKYYYQRIMLYKPFEYSRDWFKTLNIDNHSELLIIKIIKVDLFIYYDPALLNYSTKDLNINFLFV
jgi:hypothetical protein